MIMWAKALLSYIFIGITPESYLTIIHEGDDYMVVNFVILGIIIVLAVVIVCVLYGLAVKKDCQHHAEDKAKINERQKLINERKYLEEFLCHNTGDSMDDRPIYDETFPYKKIGLNRA